MAQALMASNAEDTHLLYTNPMMLSHLGDFLGRPLIIVSSRLLTVWK